MGEMGIGWVGVGGVDMQKVCVEANGQAFITNMPPSLH